MKKWSHDLVLRALVELPEPVGSLVRSFPGIAAVADEPDWLDKWFTDLVEAYATDSAPEDVPITATSADEAEADLSILAKPPVETDVRLLSIEPHYFRGFREIDRPVALQDGLVVVEGRNSSGKTSLSEAMEWVFTGVLSRRSSGQYGHPRELANCITNEFRPDGERTWVELVLSVDDTEMKLRRVLKVDYAAQKASEPESTLTVDGKELGEAEERALLDRLFAGLHPILMQHTLRQFVHDDPTARRQYFERLLQIDELTELISRAVVGNTTIESFKPQGGSPALDAVELLLKSVESDDARSRLQALFSADAASSQEEFRTALVAVAVDSFPDLVGSDATYNECHDALEGAQASAREAELPVLGALRGPIGRTLPDADRLVELQEAAAEARHAFDAAETAAAGLDDAHHAVAKAFDLLAAANLIAVDLSGDQECPICLDPGATLRADRVSEIGSWTPLASALDVARKGLSKRRSELASEVEVLRSSSRGFEVTVPTEADLAEMLKDLEAPIQAAVRASCDAAVEMNAIAQSFAAELEKVNDTHPLDAEALAPFPTCLQQYRERMSHLEDLVGASARQDASYLARERWIAATGTIASLAGEITWIGARKKAQGRLESIRKGLIKLRQKIIEDARKTFSEQITEVWELLRSDTGAKFSQLRIPSARGRGYKLELEVKATITDGNDTKEVDALRVFSESQVNVIGVAAYVTRSRLLGHRVLIFDDPVQSMDEEHFRTFANTLVGKLLDEGFQVVMLTHSDEFARRISHYHYQRADYATLRTRFSKRKGCQVDEGNRRIPERLKRAEKLGEDGKLEDGWRLVRLSIERLYKLVMARNSPDFDPDSWRNATADDMWNQGAGPLVEAAVSGAGTRLKEILDQAAVGAHDKTATSQTDLNDAISYLRSLLNPLRVGG